MRVPDRQRVAHGRPRRAAAADHGAIVSSSGIGRAPSTCASGGNGARDSPARQPRAPRRYPCAPRTPWPPCTSPTSSRPSTGGASAALARRHHRLRRGAGAGRGLRADGLLPRERVRRGHACRARARDAWLAWYATTPDAPCIAICSTSQGDDVCKGCGRTLRRGAALAGDDAGREARTPGAASRWKARPGASTATPSAPRKRRARPPAGRAA